jgi:hypothetical protein
MSATIYYKYYIIMKLNKHHASEAAQHPLSKPSVLDQAGRLNFRQLAHTTAPQTLHPYNLKP